MNDFEDWKTGTHRWKIKQGADTISTTKLGWNTFDFTVIGSLELADGYLIFDSDAAELRGDVTLRGVFAQTREGTKVAVFNFMTVFLGKDVKVRFIGKTAISIMSRSAMIIDTELRVRPGTLGGFPGGGFIGAETTNNNRNGPGSTNVRVYVETISTFGTHIPEIQEIETLAASGQKIQGHFVIFYGEDERVHTQPISYDATAYDVKVYLETAFPKIGMLHVERDDTRQQIPESGRLWRVTFFSAVGNLPQLRAKSYLKALSSQVLTRTIRDGNQLSGTFRLGFLDYQTQALPHNVQAEELRNALLQNFPFLLDARVTRTDPLSQCVQGSTAPDQTAATTTALSPSAENRFMSSQWTAPNEVLVGSIDSVKSTQDKLCSGGRGAADGYVWKVQFWTQKGNQMPSSPTSPVAQLVDTPVPLTIDFSGLRGIGATAQVVDSLCFSLAFGGAGASFASKGGQGYATPFQAANDYAQPYSEDIVSDLLGGSGGAGGGLDPIDLFPVVQPTLGGAGAGAIMLSAVNDILIGLNGKILVNGGHGGPGYTAGGGGSGGTLLLISGGSISHHGVLEALGGHGGSSTPFSDLRNPAHPGGGGSGGRVAIFAQTFSSWGDGRIIVSGGASQDPLRVGSKGSSFIQVQSNLALRVDPTIGAAGTTKSLLIDGSEGYESGSDGILDAQSHQIVRNGPRFVLDAPSRPTRISYFVRIGNFGEGKITNNRGAIFGVHSSGRDDDKDEFMISIGIIDGVFTHEPNAFQWPRRTFQPKIQPNRWYKVDLFINWYQHTYSIQLNDILKVQNVTFNGVSVGSVSVNNLHAMSTWWDEIYVGKNHLMGFVCPHVIADKRSTAFTSNSQSNGHGNGVVVVKGRQLRKLWATSFQGPATSYHPMVRHESHLSAQAVFQYNNGGIVPLDGARHREFLDDIHERESETPDGSSEEDLDANEILSESEILILPDVPQDNTIVKPLETGIDFATLAADDASGGTHSSASASSKATMYWYSEVFNETTLVGGIGACSTLDYIEWRNEGIMLHFVNLTDPFGGVSTMGILLADRPKMIFNSETNQFVMWMHVDNKTNTMGLTGIATSAFPNGPFEFQRSFYPDGAPLEAPGGQSINETHDQTIAVIPSANKRQPDCAYLIRSYYKTVEYWLPRPVMDPLWQSVQTPEGKTDFGLSYHRAFYHAGYDNPNDIYLQRWRMEDRPWELICCEPTNQSHCVSYTQIPSNASVICPDGMEKTHILGQSQMNASNHIMSRYKDPNDDANSFFIPHSVASHTSWGFQVYNVKTWRGNYFDALSTNITLFIFKRFAGERRRNEIEKDPSIPYEYPNEEERTQAVIPMNDTEILDLLLGTLGVPVSTAFRAKISSFDLLEIDINDDGKITSSEIAQLLKKSAQKKLTSQLVTSLMADFEVMKWSQVDILDANGDGVITFPEFEKWVGLDPNLLFDQFDIDKNGFLDENELARTLWYRQMPRLDTAMILLDPSFDGRVYYQRFRSLVLETPDFIFQTYDFDDSNTLTQNEIDLMIKDLGTSFADASVLDGLKNATTKSISKQAYAAWLSSSTSLLGGSRNRLKADNVVHGTRPDSLMGPLHVVERRRAKYVAISRLTRDYHATEGLLREIEGDFEGREALVSYFEFAEQLFGLRDDDGPMELMEPFRVFLSSQTLQDRASYWNGRHWEGRPSAPSLFTYGHQCLQVAGVDASDSGCLPCLTRSPYVTSTVDVFQSQSRSTAHCEPQKELDAYIKEFDQQVSIQLQYQQQSVYGPQGLQPHMSPCFNQSQFFPCDVHKVLDGNIADALRDAHARETQWHLAWEQHSNDVGSSTKIRANDAQPASFGPSFIERFSARLREPLDDQLLDAVAAYSPDQWTDILGGGS
uniref:EF-hand domain-containing protein n=1 Tax=Globisporangium ultimum (strain ATCC 200006 / CBS 805.95 / DAOM BR144) TaxID=431595 RepID=K3X2K1_GLOUD